MDRRMSHTFSDSSHSHIYNRLLKDLALFMLLVFVPLLSIAQHTNVTGIVTDEEGEPLAGVSVICSGTKIGVATDADGRFSITVPSKVKTLEFSYIGMETQTVAVASSLNVRMKAKESSMLDEVVVVAFGEQKRASFTGSAGVVKSEELNKIATNDPIQAMAGKIAGVQMNTSSGSPTATQSIQIRGTGSINASNEPLYIIDGSPLVGSSYLVNPEDVESITVLKDAASNALYGARGANGVIMITTKKGKTGPARITLNAKLGAVSRAVQDYEKVTDPRAYYELLYQAHYNHEIRDNGTTAANAHIIANQMLGKGTSDGGLGYLSYSVPDGEYLIGSNGKMNPNATAGNIVSYNGQEFLIRPDDWIEESFRTGLRQDYSINVSGGTKAMNYYATLGYLNNEGIVKGSDYERYTFRLKTDMKLRSWLNFNVNMSYAKATANSASTGSASIFSTAIWYAPVYPMYLRDSNGNVMRDENGVMYDYGDGRVTGLVRPFATGDNSVQENLLRTRCRDRGILNLGGTLNISVPWVKGLKAQIKTNVVQNTSNYTSTYQPFYGQSAMSYPKGQVSQEATKTYAYNHQQLLTYVRQFGVHNINFMAGHEYFRQTGNTLAAAKKNMFSYWGNQTLDGAVTVINTSIEGNQTVYNTEGWFTRLMYDYDDRYFISGSYRRDASSRFHPDHRWGNFYSLGAAWIMSKEEWFPKIPQINMLKLKASWGQQGNDGIGNYLYTTNYAISNVNDDIGLTMSTVKGTKNITWETNNNFNAGVEFELFNSRLSGEIEYFNRKTTDMLCQIRVPLDAGYAYQYGNIGDMRNEGVEITLNFDVIRSRNFNWNIYANATHYKNRILKLNEDNKGTDLEGHPGYVSGSYFYGEGLSIHSWRLRRFAGVDHSTGEALYYNKADTGELTTTTNYSDASYFYCGTSDPTIYGGFGTTMVFKGFDLSAQFAYSIGGKAFDSGYQSLMGNPSSGYTASAYHKDIYKAWSETNTGSNIPRFQYAVSETDLSVSDSSDRFLRDASTLSLQNINLGYTLPKTLLNRVGIERMRLFASGDNLYYWSKRKGFDPRNSFWGTQSLTGYSLTRTFTFGLELGF